jgi:hypothetical protein
VSRRDLGHGVASPGGGVHGWRTETGDQLFVEVFSEGFEIARIGDIIAEQEVQRFFVAGLPLMPETNGLPSVESDDVLVTTEAQFLLDGLETSSEPKPPCGEA